MREFIAGVAALALLCGAYAASAAPAPGSVDTVQPPASPPPAATPPASPPAATTPATPPAASVPSATDNRGSGGEARFITEGKTKKPKKRRFARHGYYGYPYYRRPFFYAHPRSFWPFYRHRYRYYRYPRRYYRPFWGWRW